MTEPEPWGGNPAPPPPPPQYGQQWGAPPPPPPAPGFYPMYQPARQTNAMAITALVCGFVLPPLAIIFGHMALSQIKRSGEEGKGLAVAGLVIGYVFTGGILLWIVFFVVIAAIFTKATHDYQSSWLTTTTTSYPYESNEQAIKNARVGQCVDMVDSGNGTITSISRVDCNSYSATHRVTMVTTSTSNCSTADWARSADQTVVLCLVKE